jgi:hypothetical protein
MEHAMRLIVLAARVELLILSDLTATPDRPYTETDVRDAIRRVIKSHGGLHAAIADSAGELGDHPDIWAVRCTWARGLVDSVYPAAPRQRSRTVRSSNPVVTASA